MQLSTVPHELADSRHRQICRLKGFENELSVALTTFREAEFEPKRLRAISGFSLGVAAPER
jgi:hypothetical protein